MMIRPATHHDLPAILAIYTPYVLQSTCTFEYTVPSMEEFSARFDAITAQFPWLVWEEQGKILGYAYGSLPFERAAYRWCAEDSVYLAPEAMGRGIGKALLLALEHCLQAQGYQVVYAIITEENAHSRAFHQHLGYREIAQFPRCGFKFGRWLGVTWMEKRLNSVEFPSVAPVSWAELSNFDGNFSDILDKMSLSK